MDGKKVGRGMRSRDEKQDMHRIVNLSGEANHPPKTSRNGKSSIME